MTAHQYPITDTNPVQIGTGLQGSLTLYNESTTTTVYVGEYPNRNGFPLGPGMTLTWDQGKSLYAYMDTVNQNALLDVVENGGQITSPGQIAAQILQQGLASAIANSISITGAPPINKMDLLLSTSLAVPLLATEVFSAAIDLSKYQSVLVIVEQVTGAFTSVTPVPRTVNLIWFDTLADAQGLVGSGVVQLVPFWTTDSNGYPSGSIFTSLVMPVVSPALLVGMIGDGVAAANVTLKVYGSMRAVEDISFTHLSGYQYLPPAPTVSFGSGDPREGLVFAEYPSKAGGNAIITFPSHKNGRAVLRVEGTGVTTAGGFQLVDLVTGGALAYLFLPVAGPLQTVQADIVLGTRPIEARFDAALVTTGPLRFVIENPL